MQAMRTVRKETQDSMSKLNKSELWVAVIGIVGSTCTAVLASGLVPPTSVAAAVLSIAVTACTYIAGRSWVKGKEGQKSVSCATYTADSGRGSSITTSLPTLPTSTGD